jgi:hypothetical protein
VRSSSYKQAIPLDVALCHAKKYTGDGRYASWAQCTYKPKTTREFDDGSIWPVCGVHANTYDKAVKAEDDDKAERDRDAGWHQRARALPIEARLHYGHNRRYTESVVVSLTDLETLVAARPAKEPK